MSALITSHAWRPFNSVTRPDGVGEEACAFMNCRRLRAEHARSVTGKLGRRPAR